MGAFHLPAKASCPDKCERAERSGCPARSWRKMTLLDDASGG